MTKIITVKDIRRNYIGIEEFGGFNTWLENKYGYRFENYSHLKDTIMKEHPYKPDVFNEWSSYKVKSRKLAEDIYDELKLKVNDKFPKPLSRKFVSKMSTIPYPYEPRFINVSTSLFREDLDHEEIKERIFKEALPHVFGIAEYHEDKKHNVLDYEIVINVDYRNGYPSITINAWEEASGE